jgi:ketosteroid isomerase-like protein
MKNIDDRMAKRLVETYVDGWRRNDLQNVLSPLSPDCIVIESHGPTFHGIEAIRQWVENWISAGSRIDGWDITSFHFLEDAAAFEWDFECVAGGRHYHIEGVSIVEFSEGKISAVREYRRTEAPYDGLNPSQ